MPMFDSREKRDRRAERNRRKRSEQRDRPGLFESEIRAGEKIELEKARNDIARMSVPVKKSFGCESRQFVWAKSEPFIERFAELFNFATITHYVWDSWYELFEPREGRYNWGIKDDAVRWLAEHDITIEGRPLFWFHPTVTPEWLKNKSFADLKSYVEKHPDEVKEPDSYVKR